MENVLLTTSLNFFRNSCCLTLSGVGTLWRCPHCRRDVPSVPWWAPWFPPGFLLKEAWARDVDGELLVQVLEWTRPKSVPTPCKSAEHEVPLSVPGYRNWRALITAVWWFSRLHLWKQKEEWQASCPDIRAQLPMPWKALTVAAPSWRALNHFCVWCRVWLRSGTLTSRQLGFEVSNVHVIKWCQLSSRLESRPAHFHCPCVPLDLSNHCILTIPSIDRSLCPWDSSISIILPHCTSRPQCCFGNRTSCSCCCDTPAYEGMAC